MFIRYLRVLAANAGIGGHGTGEIEYTSSTKLISIHGKSKFGLKKLSAKVKRLQFSICQLYLVPIKEGKKSKVIELFITYSLSQNE